MFGMFESETVVTVSTTVNRVIEDRLIPNSVKTGTIKGIFSGDQLVENIMEDLVGSLGVKAERMYSYGKKSYPYGAPTSKIYKSTNTELISKAVVQALEGKDVVFDYANYGPINRQHYGWQKLCDSYGYNPDSNELTTLSAAKGFPVYLEDMQVMLSPDKLTVLTGLAYDQWGAAATAGYTPLRPKSGSIPRTQTPIGVDQAALADYLRVTVIWNDATPIVVGGASLANNSIKREVLNIPMLVPVVEAEYVQLKYRYVTQVQQGTIRVRNALGIWGDVPNMVDVTTTKFFTYQVGMGTYPELDNLYSSAYDSLGTFFPFGYFRYNRAPTSTDVNSPEYKAANKLMKYLGLDYVQINEAINTNPQINEVESALLMLMVPAVSADQVECRYLFDFFKGMYLQTGAIATPEGAANPMSWAISKIWQELNKKVSSTGDSISLQVRDSRFSTYLGMSGLYRKVVSGVIGKIGTYASGTSIMTTTHTGDSYEDADNDGVAEKVQITWTTTTPYHYYRKQITEHLYEEVQVTGLRRTYDVWGGHATTNSMIPLDHSITEKMSVPDREHLYSRSLHYIFNSKHEEEVEWYQQEWFGTVLIIIAVGWTVFTLGSDGGSGMAAAIAAGTVTLEMIVVAMIVTAIEALIIQTVAKLFVRMLGPEFALLVAVVAAAYGMYSSFGTSTGSMDSMLAQNLLSVSNSMISEVSAGYKKDLELLKKEGEEFNLFAQAKMDELEKVREEMEGSRLLSPFILFGESPTNYFNRTVHAGNIGIHGLNAIENYCSMALRLPELEQTIDFGQA